MPSKPCFSTAKIRNLYRFQPKQEGNEPIETFGLCELSLNALSQVVTVAICHTSHVVTHITIVTCRKYPQVQPKTNSHFYKIITGCPRYQLPEAPLVQTEIGFT